MADENQNNQNHSGETFKDQVMRSLRGEDSQQDHSALSENDSQNLSQTNKPADSESRTWLSEQTNTSTSTENIPAQTDEQAESVGSRRSGNHSAIESETDTFSTTSIAEEENEEGTKKQRRRKEDRIVSRIVLIVVSVLVLVIAIFGFTFYKYVSDGLKPLDKEDKNLVQVYIPEGSSNKKIASILEESKVIKSGMVFNYYAKFQNLSGFQAGYYQMSPNMTLDEIGAALREGGTAEPTQIADGKVTIPEGYDIDKIGDAIEKNTNFKKEEFIELMKNEEFFNLMQQKYPELLESAAAAQGVRYRLEGYLFPATYDYYQDIQLQDFVEQMVSKTNSVLEQYIPMIHARNMTNQQVLTLASLVEKEGVKEDDRRKIAQVFYNRIAQNMPLQSDISILYSLGVHKELVTYEDLEVDSPYNLYKNTGYGPGPLDSPSEQAISAVLNPEDNNYLYFVADIETGNVYFTETYEEHQANVEKYVNKADE